jgi:ATP/maltotriose-dependent transcriptional regulator MalT
MATVEVPFDLIEAKIAPPALRAETVVKSELIDRLCATEPRVVSVVAPPGFGKTTLLANWAQRDPRPFATVALDERDNDPMVLFRYVATALNRVQPISPSVFDALSGPGRSVWSTCIPRVGAALSAVTNPVVLVLEDVHFRGGPDMPRRRDSTARARPRGVADRGGDKGRAGTAAGTAARPGRRAGARSGRPALERRETGTLLSRFLVPLDRNRTWYRYHHLFRDLLRSELERREPGLAPELNRRAMGWCVANGMPEAAIHDGHEAGETDADDVERAYDQQQRRCKQGSARASHRVSPLVDSATGSRLIQAPPGRTRTDYREATGDWHHPNRMKLAG